LWAWHLGLVLGRAAEPYVSPTPRNRSSDAPSVFHVPRKGVGMTSITHSTKATPVITDPTAPDGFDLDVTLVELADVAGLISLTDDGCGSTCGACTTNVA